MSAAAAPQPLRRPPVRAGARRPAQAPQAPRPVLDRDRADDGAEVIAYGMLAILHAANPDHHGPAGGIENLGHGMSVLVLLGGIAAMIVGASAGADDLASGVFRELVVTGRSRVALFGARIPGGLAFVLAFGVCVRARRVVATLRPGTFPRRPRPADRGVALGPRGARLLLLARSRHCLPHQLARVHDRHPPRLAEAVGPSSPRSVLSATAPAFPTWLRPARPDRREGVRDRRKRRRLSAGPSVVVLLLWVAICRRRCLADRHARRLSGPGGSSAGRPAEIHTTGEPVKPRPPGPSRKATTSATSSGSSSRFTAWRSRMTSSSTRSSGRSCARAWSAICASTSGVRT